MIEVLGSNGLYAVLAIVIIAVASLFGLVVFVSKEEKFEDVVAAQKKEQEALIQSLNASTGKPSKSKKKWAKIKKEKSAKAHDKKDEPEAIPVGEGSIKDEAIFEQLDVVEIPKPEVEELPKLPKKTKKDKKKKEKNVVQKAEAPVEEEIVEVIEETVEAVQDMSELEAAPSSESAMMQQFVDDSLAAIDQASNLAKDSVVVQEQKQKESSQKKPKNKKAKTAAPSESHISVGKIASDLEKAHLNNIEVQKLIDMLLDKQNELQQWQKPNQKAEPMDELKKRLHELESQLGEEKKTSVSAVQKNKELRQEIQQEKTQLQRFQSQANQKMSQQAGEIQALQKRMEATQENHVREMQNSQAQLQKFKDLLDQSPAVELQRLKEENALYKNASIRVNQITDEKNALYAEYGQLKQASVALKADLDSAHLQLQQYQQQQKHYEEKLKSIENEMQDLEMSKGESEAVLSSRLVEVSKQLERTEEEKKYLSRQLDHAQNTLNDNSKSRQADGELEKVKTALKAAEDKVKHCEEVEAKNNDLLKKLAEEKSELEEKLKREEIVIVEKQESSGDITDAGVSQEEHSQLITEKDKVISELKEDMKSTKEELERLAKVLEQEKHEKDENVKSLQENVNTLEEKAKKLEEEIGEKKQENKKMEEVVDAAKSKNNDLREKNWKAMDALSTAEANGKKKLKATEEAVCKTLKTIRPAINLEKGKPIEDVLKAFEEEFMKSDKKKKRRGSGSSSSSDSDSDSDSDAESKSMKKMKNENESLAENNKNLENKLAVLTKEKSNLEQSLKTTSGERDKLKQLAEESKNANVQVQHYKGILEQTESMLKELQNGVESQVSSYERKLEAKESELKQLSGKVLRLEEEIKNNDDKSQLEKDLKKVQVELESEKKAKIDLESELDEAKQRINVLEEASEHGQSEDSIGLSQESLDTSGSSSPKKKKSLRHALSKAFRKKNEGPDDLKHKLASAEDHVAQMEAEKKELLEKLGQVSDSAKAKEEELEKLKGDKQSVDKENSKLQEKLKAVKEAGDVSGKSDKEKDKIIAKLKLEIAELLEDLRDERDRVVVDVESVDSEKLKSELETLKDDYEKEKDTSGKLNSSIHELEEQLQKKILEVNELEEKYKKAADKLVVSEQRSKELELAGLSKSERIEKEIDEAIQSDNSPTSPQRTIGTPLVDQLDEIKRQLADKDKQLDTEKHVNQQLRAQVAALANEAAHGTSV